MPNDVDVGTDGREDFGGSLPAGITAHPRTAAGSMAHTLLDDSRVEFPRVDDRRIGRRHRHAAPATETGRADLLPGEHDAVRWYDTGTGAAGVRPAAHRGGCACSVFASHGQ
ncbi:hypothetical protein [Streptomyces sp. NPDC000410]|uniref:hypothetical protein n=1 Tax=Streptomyces sp. NPDC000410 TaxID=3154254 RepID=UPI0033211C0A